MEQKFSQKATYSLMACGNIQQERSTAQRVDRVRRWEVQQ